MLGRLLKDTTEISGSVQGSQRYGYQTAFGVFFSGHHVSCSAVVDIESGETLKFEYGFYTTGVSSGGFQTSVGTTTTTDGIVLTIIPADNFAP